MGDDHQGHNVAPDMSTWRAGYGANSYVRFGGRSEETGGLEGSYRVSLRPYWNVLGELVHPAAGQRPAHQAGARPKNRRQGLRVGVPRRLKEVSM